MTSNTAQSIYSGAPLTTGYPSRESRAARRKMRAARARTLDEKRVRTDRKGPLVEALRAFVTDPNSQALPLYVAFVAQEVQALEAAVAQRSDRQSGSTIRRALALLRTFGHLTTLNFASVPEEERHQLVQLLALEHRFCYAAAGTSRADFKEATGRTGAR